ncbi:hypothetical protein KSF_081100 [Reticulibacter mediterranei]|uniref:Uncharacterized protein n=1 Tax=Reticulibacter mediterranei TaxID=2778369 RepID=A0A8J3N4C8_9CHLR|nr:hypothetical protein [Reticulibacter mediterranei]GHO98062.1 hypothetical protein KSF_081100 [Reticulibacter mediterranei]
MHEAVVSPLPAWANFYVIVGGAAAALTGLMFVVITLIAGVRGRQTSASVAAFGTPTVVHFCAALLIAAILSAPWPALWQAAILLGIIGFSGTIYGLVVFRRARIQDTYEPVLEDWMWHVILPLVAYTAIFISAIVLSANLTPALFVIGAATVLFLFIGIHNAWDTVTYVSIERVRKDKEELEEHHS